MEQIKIDMLYVDEGYGIQHFAQNAGTFEIIVKGLPEEETLRANAIVSRAWDWICNHIEDIKDYLSVELGREFEEMR